MNSRNIVRLFISTLVVGGVTSGFIGIIARWGEYVELFTSFELLEILSVFVWLVGVGFLFSVISQAGFFAYLTVHRFGLGLFKSQSVWTIIQLFIIVVVMIDLVYLRYIFFADGEGVLTYITPAALIIVFAGIVSYIKMKQTNKHAFVPSMFFMTVITITEWFPVLRENDEGWLYFMLVPLLVCNAYQILILNRLIDKSQKELLDKKARNQTISKHKKMKAKQV